MKLTQIIKASVIPILTVFSLLLTSNAALADYLIGEGSGGNYRYELWSDDNNNYYLKIWTREASENSDRYTITTGFASSRDALIHFDCNYAGKSLPECPR
ncbi:hypothetical protein [Calothrix sp. PCC 7507]|uniref:hypothetical protein n=1 Tax=Calothrix sp. PCC 7507 TaxID=99598 RepID=UPI00029ED3ED|nr:hypothetical protein [Calothrix sp. PCC 7507]AFY34427.1 hypothetical protein Cal7507_4043 [Calothrix sp. PCC 7507]